MLTSSSVFRSKFRGLLGLSLDCSWSLDAELAESDEKDRNLPPFDTRMLEVFEVYVLVFGLLDLRKEKMDGALTPGEDLEGDRELVGT